MSSSSSSSPFSSMSLSSHSPTNNSSMQAQTKRQKLNPQQVETSTITPGRPLIPEQIQLTLKNMPMRIRKHVNAGYQLPGKAKINLNGADYADPLISNPSTPMKNNLNNPVNENLISQNIPQNVDHHGHIHNNNKRKGLITDYFSPRPMSN